MASRFDGESIFSTILGFTPHSDYKQYNEDISQEYIVNCESNYDCIDDGVVNGAREPILFSFFLDKLPG